MSIKNTLQYFKYKFVRLFLAAFLSGKHPGSITTAHQA